HVLIAGTTGAGKTALAHSILLSLAARQRPSQVGVVMLDPKLHAEGVTEALRAHLLLPPAREVGAALAALQRVVQVMERRDLRREPLPRVVVCADELADLCQAGGSAMVELLTRIAQRGREAGVHLLACTQKPSARAIGSLLKANLPLRLVGRVLSAHDAQLASGIAGSGAEKLLGSGDFLAVSAAGVTRFQAALPVLEG
ncbi:MAG: FtsK/SpoIIIE domain-containing protein, partial [Thermoflexales bacterium]